MVGGDMFLQVVLKRPSLYNGCVSLNTSGKQNVPQTDPKRFSLLSCHYQNILSCPLYPVIEMSHGLVRQKYLWKAQMSLNIKPNNYN